MGKQKFLERVQNINDQRCMKKLEGRIVLEIKSEKNFEKYGVVNCGKNCKKILRNVKNKLLKMVMISLLEILVFL